MLTELAFSVNDLGALLAPMATWPKLKLDGVQVSPAAAALTAIATSSPTTNDERRTSLRMLLP